MVIEILGLVRLRMEYMLVAQNMAGTDQNLTFGK